MSAYGKYRALVTNDKDPEARGRVRVKCPAIYGDFESPWCLPCIPYFFDLKPESKSTASSSQGVSTSVSTKTTIEITDGFPETGDSIWIEFEEGNTNKPIWVGHWEWTGEVRKA